jgi:hypothetical protein
MVCQRRTAAQMGLDAVHRGRIKIVPDRFVKIWDNWLENIRPGASAASLWWGHRIPAGTAPIPKASDRGPQRSRSDPPKPKKSMARTSHHPGPGRAGHLVQQRPMALFHIGLAGKHARFAALLPHRRDGNRLRHFLLLGGPHGDVWRCFSPTTFPSTPSTCMGWCGTNTAVK